MKKALIATAALTIGVAAYTLPASATIYDSGHYAYTQNEPSYFSPDGLPKSVIGKASDGDVLTMRDQLFGIKDSKHQQW